MRQESTPLVPDKKVSTTQKAAQKLEGAFSDVAGAVGLGTLAGPAAYGLCGAFRRYIKLLMAPLSVISVHPSEEELRIMQRGESMPASYLVWRRLQLSIAVPVMIVKTIENCIAQRDAFKAFGHDSTLEEWFATATRDGSAEFLTIKSFDDVMALIREAFWPIEYAMLLSDLVSTLITFVFATIFTMVALYFWSNYGRSSKSTMTVMGFLFALPFVLFLVPFRELADLGGLQMDLCRVIVNDPNVAFILRPLQDSSPDYVCRNPERFIDDLEVAMDNQGILYHEALGTCPRAEQVGDYLALKTPDVIACRGGGVGGLLPLNGADSCAPCRNCMPYAMALSQTGKTAADVAEQLNTTEATPIPEHCVACATDRSHGANKDKTCPELCAEYFLAVDEHFSSYCIQKENLDKLRKAAGLLRAATDGMRTVIGLYWGFQSLAYLLPACTRPHVEPNDRTTINMPAPPTAVTSPALLS